MMMAARSVRRNVNKSEQVNKMSVRQLTPITKCRVLFISNIQFKIIASKSVAAAIVAVAVAVNVAVCRLFLLLFLVVRVCVCRFGR